MFLLKLQCTSPKLVMEGPPGKMWKQYQICLNRCISPFKMWKASFLWLLDIFCNKDLRSSNKKKWRANNFKARLPTFSITGIFSLQIFRLPILAIFYALWLGWFIMSLGCFCFIKVHWDVQIDPSYSFHNSLDLEWWQIILRVLIV